MKKNALALAVAGVFAGVASVPSVGMAAVGPTLYGVGHVSADYVNNGDTQDVNLSSNKSRIGVKGSYDLGNGLAAIYLMEWQVNMTNTDQGQDTLEARNRYIGLKSDTWGTLIGGRHDTPVKVIGAKVDLFWHSQMGQNRNITATTGHDERADNVIGYISPNFGPVHFFGAYVTSITTDAQDNPARGVDNSYNTDNHNDNAYSGALIYDQNGLFLAVGGEIINCDQRFTCPGKNQANLSRNNDSTSAVRVTGKWNLNDWTLTGFYEYDMDAGFVDGNDGSMAGGGLAYKMGNNVFKGQLYWKGNYDNAFGSASNSKSVLYSAGWDHYFSKSVQLYLTGAFMDNDQRANLKLGGFSHSAVTQPAVGENPWSISTGMRIKF